MASRKGEICQARHDLCCCVLWRKRKTAFHSRKVNSKLYRESLLPKLIEDCKSCLLSGLIFQQVRAPAHTAKLAQNWIPPTAVTSSENTNGHRTHHTLTLLTIMSDELCVTERYKTFQPKPSTIDELKKVLQSMWNDLPQNSRSQQCHI